MLTAAPEVRRFFRAATMHLDAAKVLLKACPSKGSSLMCQEAVYLAGYTGECSLKARWLSHHKIARHDEILDYLKTEVGHDLEALRLALLDKGINIPKGVVKDIHRIRSCWSSQMRYLPSQIETDLAVALVTAAESIKNWVSRGT